MKYWVFFLAGFGLTFSGSYAQDTLYLRGQSAPFVVKILTINPDQIEYKKFDYPDGPLYMVFKAEVEKIHYKSGMKDYFEKPEKKEDQPAQTGQAPRPKQNVPLSVSGMQIDQLSFTDGEMDARMYYQGYKGTSIGSFAAGLFFIYGLPVPIVTSLTRANNAYLYNPNQEALKLNMAYAQGYQTRANRIKAGKAWSNFGLGMGTTVVITAAIIFVALQSLSNP